MRLTSYLNQIPVPNMFSLFLQNIVENNSHTNELCLTHKFCNQKALELLEKRHNAPVISVLKKNFSALQSGVVWADLNFKSVNHFFNPLTKKGLWKFMPAIYIFVFYLSKAKQYAKERNGLNTFFYLGAATHILQDMTVPHHVCGCLFNGHKEFEGWVQSHLDSFSFLTSDSWPACHNPIDLLTSNAEAAAVFMSVVDDSSAENMYYHTACILLLLAQTSSAAFFEWFIEKKVLPYMI